MMQVNPEEYRGIHRVFTQAPDIRLSYVPSAKAGTFSYADVCKSTYSADSSTGSRDPPVVPETHKRRSDPSRFPVDLGSITSYVLAVKQARPNHAVSTLESAIRESPDLIREQLDSGNTKLKTLYLQREY